MCQIACYLLNVVDTARGGGEAGVHAEDRVVHGSGEGQVAEDRAELPPQRDLRSSD